MRSLSPAALAFPVETPPGEVAQVDFGEIGRLWDPESGCLRRAGLSVMVLGHSRRMVARIVFDQKVETWLQVHVEAFAELGGVPEVVVPDNLKAAVVRADPASVRQPKTQGKIEFGVRDVSATVWLASPAPS